MKKPPFFTDRENKTWAKFKSFDSRSPKLSFLYYPKSTVNPYHMPERAWSIDEWSHFIEAKTDLKDTV